MTLEVSVISGVAKRTLFSETETAICASSSSSSLRSSPTVLRRLFDKAKFAISTEETRYYLNGVFMHAAEGASGKVLRCVATDGHRLARIDADLPEGASDIPGVIVPRKTVGELRKVIQVFEGHNVKYLGLQTFSVTEPFLRR